MSAKRDANNGAVNRRTALALMASASAVWNAGGHSTVQAQPAPPLGPPQILNGADARVFPTDIRSELKRLAPTTP